MFFLVSQKPGGSRQIGLKSRFLWAPLNRSFSKTTRSFCKLFDVLETSDHEFSIVRILWDNTQRFETTPDCLRQPLSGCICLHRFVPREYWVDSRLFGSPNLCYCFVFSILVFLWDNIQLGETTIIPEPNHHGHRGSRIVVSYSSGVVSKCRSCLTNVLKLKTHTKLTFRNCLNV